MVGSQDEGDGEGDDERDVGRGGERGILFCRMFEMGYNKKSQWRLFNCRIGKKKWLYHDYEDSDDDEDDEDDASAVSEDDDDEDDSAGVASDEEEDDEEDEDDEEGVGAVTTSSFASSPPSSSSLSMLKNVSASSSCSSSWSSSSSSSIPIGGAGAGSAKTLDEFEGGGSYGLPLNEWAWVSAISAGFVGKLAKVRSVRPPNPLTHMYI